MSDLSANKQVCVNFLNQLSKRAFADAVACLSEDIDWWVQGTWDMPTSYHGKAAVNQLIGALEHALDGDLAIELGALTAEEDRVAVEMRSWAPLRNGKAYAMSYHYLFRVQDGLIVEGKEYLDTKHLAEAIFA